MFKISLASYSITIHANGSSRQNLGKFDGQHNLIDQFEAYCSELKQQGDLNTGDNHFLKVSDFCVSSEQIIGTLQIGEYGYSSQLYSIDASSVAHDRKTDEAELIPLFFLFHIPSNQDRGIAIFQRFGKTGVRTVLGDSFDAYFRKKFSKYKVKFNPLIPSELLNYYIKEGELKSLEFTRFSLPKDIADIVLNDGFAEHFESVKVQVSAKRNSSLPKPSWLFNRGQNGEFTNILELLSKSEYEELKLQVKLGDSVKSIDFTKLNSLNAYFDITNQVELDHGGHPKFQSIKILAQDLLRDLQKEVNLNYDYKV